MLDFSNQNQYQNAGQNGYFSNVSIANQSSTFFMIALVIVVLVALLRSERRNRELYQRLSGTAPE